MWISMVEASRGALREKLRRGFVGTNLSDGAKTFSSLCWRLVICGVKRELLWVYRSRNFRAER
jgi:hypothetical protein